jgi:hypothetical protein
VESQCEETVVWKQLGEGKRRNWINR